MKAERKETPFERRIRELEEEASRLQRNIKTINKALDRGDLEELQAIRPARVEPPRGPASPPPPPARAPVSAPVPAPVPAAPAEELLPVAAPEANPPPAAAPALPASAPEVDDVVAWRAMPRAPQRPGAVRGNERFASYLSSGSFGKSRPVGVERRVQRNKAIFALLLAVLLSFILYKLLS